MNTSPMEPGESVIFQPVLQAYPTRPLLDCHCSHITWKSGTPLGALQEATHKDSTIPQILRTTPISIHTTAYYSAVRTV